MPNDSSSNGAQPSNRCAIYIRTSTAKQAESGKASLPAQEASARAYAAERTPPLEVVRVYTEPGYSGTKYNRPTMDQVRRDAHAGLFDWLIIDFGDRFTRGGIAHYGRFLSEFDEAGVRVYLVYERLDLSDPQQRMMGAFIAHQAEEDNRKRAERRRRTYEDYATQGHYVCGKRPPYGFRFPPDERRPDGRLKKGRLIADPVTGPVMQRLFRALAAGATLASLKAELEREHIPTPMGKTLWDVAVISKLLRNPIYWGEASVKLKGVTYRYPPGVVEPLIDRETALVVQARLSQNRRYSPRTLNTRLYTVLAGGRGRCAFCGHALSPHHENANRRAGSPPYITYRCGFATKHYNDCPAPRVRADLADQLVWDTLRDLLLSPDKLAALAEQQAQAELRDDPGSEVQRLKRLLSDTTRKRDNLYAAVAEASNKDVRAGLLTQLELAETSLTTYRTELAALELHLTAYEARRQTLANVTAWATRYRALFLLHEPTDPRGREVIRAVLRALNVTALVGKNTDGVTTAHLTVEVAGPLPYWYLSFGDLDAEALATTQAALTDPDVVAAFAALTDRLQVQRESHLSSLSLKTRRLRQRLTA